MPTVSTAGPNSRACAVFDGVDDFMDTGLPLSDFLTDDASFAIISFMIDAVIASPLQGVLGDSSEQWGIYISTGPTVTGVNFDGTSDQIALDADDGIETGVPLVVTLRHDESSGGGGWTPAEISTLLWLDASDTSSFTFSSGSVVSQWNDKSGNGNHVSEATATNQPTRDTVTNTINSLPVVSFSGGNPPDRLNNASLSGFPSSTTGYTGVAVYRDTQVGSGERTIVDISDSGGTTSRAWLWYANQTTNFILVSRVDQDAVNQATTTGSTGQGPRVVSGLGRIDKRQLWINGTAGGTNTVLKTSRSAAYLQIGANIGELQPHKFDLAEIVIIAGESDTNRQLLEGYMAWKWGLQSDLDASHPYKSAAPSITTVNTLFLSVNGSDEVSIASDATSLMTGDLRLGMTGAGTNAAIKVFECATFDCVPAEGTRQALIQNFMDWVGAEALDAPPYIAALRGVGTLSIAATVV